MRVGPGADAMKPDFQGVRTHWNQGFMTFPKARRTRIVMLMIPGRRFAVPVFGGFAGAEPPACPLKTGNGEARAHYNRSTGLDTESIHIVTKYGLIVALCNL
jgi:hypothetical protein